MHSILGFYAYLVECAQDVFKSEHDCRSVAMQSTRAAHIDVCMHRLVAIKKKHPKLARIIKFADMRTYDLERFESEKRTEVKKRAR